MVLKENEDEFAQTGALKNQSVSEVRNIILKTSETIYVVNIWDIVRCESKSNYTEFYLKDQSRILVSKTLKHFEDLLKEHGFFRLHQSHLINLKYFDKYNKKDGGTIVMKDRSVVPVAYRKKQHLLKALESL